MEKNNNFIDSEITGDDISPEFKEWAMAYMKSQDTCVQRNLIKERILQSDELTSEDKKIFTDVFEYCEKLVSQHKPLETNLLKIYLEDIKGYDIDKINVVRILILVTLCGFKF